MKKKLSLLLAVVVIVVGAYYLINGERTKITNKSKRLPFGSPGFKNQLSNEQQLNLRYIQYLAEQQQIVDDRKSGHLKPDTAEDEARQVQSWSGWIRDRAELTGDFAYLLEYKEAQKEILSTNLIRNRNAYNEGDGRSVDQYLEDAIDIADSYQWRMVLMGFAAGKFSRGNLTERIYAGRETEYICNPNDAGIYSEDENLVRRACELATPIFEQFLNDFEQEYVAEKYRV